MIRYTRAVIQALRLTLRGESLSPARFRPLEAWIAQTLKLLAQAEKAAAKDRIDPAALQLKLDGRPTSLASALAMLRHNLLDVYPRLIRLDDPHSPTVLQSSNLNDQYRVAQFAAADDIRSPALRRALEALNAQLLNLPTIDAE